MLSAYSNASHFSHCEPQGRALQSRFKKENNGRGRYRTEATHISEARRMLDAFTSVGADRFHVTFTNIREERTDFFKNRTVPSMRYNLPAWVSRSAQLKPYALAAKEGRPEETILAGENLIVRPYSPPAVVLVQLDDLEEKQLERVRPAAFLILRTSPKERGHQAWLAVQGGDREFTGRLKRGTGADLSASGSVRLAGTGNYKHDYKANFPTVAIEEAHPGRIVTPAQLEGMGLVAPAPAKPDAASPLRCSDRPRRLAWPDYDLCMEGALARGRKRSSADFTFCCIAIDHFKRTPEETADRLMEVSTKAKENGRITPSARRCAPPKKWR